MARGRMISKCLSTSEKFAGLTTSAGDLAEFAQILYLLLIPHTDDFGRLQGDPFTIKHQCFPASPRTPEQFQDALNFLHNAELIIWYAVSGKQYVQITNFEPHQVGLHRRTSSNFPEFPGKYRKRRRIPSEEKGTEEKGTEENLLANGDKPPSATQEFIAWFVDEYKRERGSKYLVTQKHAGIAKRLVDAFGLERLKQLTVVLFNSDDDWIETTDRGFEVLAGKINWLEERLSAWEKKQQHGRRPA